MMKPQGKQEVAETVVIAILCTVATCLIQTCYETIKLRMAPTKKKKRK